jgi:hypothetical protein
MFTDKEGSKYKSELILILDRYAVSIPVVQLIPKIWIEPFGDKEIQPGIKDIYPALAVYTTNYADCRLPNGVTVKYGNLNTGEPVRLVTADGNPFVDYDFDGVNDLQDLNDDGVANELDVDGDKIADIDMDMDGIIDVDLNSDGTVDAIKPSKSGDGTAEIYLSKKLEPDVNYIPEKWSKDKTRLYAKWPKVPKTKEYFSGIGATPNDNNYTAGVTPTGWLSAESYNFKEIGNLALETAFTTKLTKDVNKLDIPPFDLLVQSISGFDYSGGVVYVGPERMRYSAVSSTVSLHIIERALDGTIAINHPVGTKVSNIGYYYNAKPRTEPVVGMTVEGVPTTLMVYRVDITPPTKPGTPKSDQEQSGKPAEGGIFAVSWDASYDLESGVKLYEIQEKTDTNPVWKTIRILPSFKTSIQIGARDIPSNVPRTKEYQHILGYSGDMPKFYYYRVRAMNYAGAYSEWSEISKPAPVVIPSEIISKVSNYPNPVDLRKGEKTTITYLLNEDVDGVVITLYDLLGYKVYEWRPQKGETYSSADNVPSWAYGMGKGAAKGTNVILWDGKNETGNFVSKGGYIAYIKIGQTTVKRKIGVIR